MNCAGQWEKHTLTVRGWANINTPTGHGTQSRTIKYYVYSHVNRVYNVQPMNFKNRESIKIVMPQNLTTYLQVTWGKNNVLYDTRIR